MSAFRAASCADLATVLDWAAAEGWNPGQGDAPAFHAADPAGFFVATDAADTPIAALSVVNHTEDFAFLGLYITRPAFRGQGIGLRLWQHGLAHAGGRVVGLDGVVAQQENYKRSGFVPAGGTARFTGAVAARAGGGIRPAARDDFEALIAWEAAASGVRKTAYLTAWFSPAATRATYVMEGDTGLSGVCTVRACREGVKIGPLIARTADAARALIRHAAGVFGGPVTLDVPQSAAGLTEICEDLGMTSGFETARMYRGRFAPARPAFFAVTSLELG